MIIIDPILPFLWIAFGFLLKVVINVLMALIILIIVALLLLVVGGILGYIYCVFRDMYYWIKN